MKADPETWRCGRPGCIHNDGTFSQIPDPNPVGPEPTAWWTWPALCGLIFGLTVLTILVTDKPAAWKTVQPIPFSKACGTMAEAIAWVDAHGGKGIILLPTGTFDPADKDLKLQCLAR